MHLSNICHFHLTVHISQAYEQGCTIRMEGSFPLKQITLCHMGSVLYKIIDSPLKFYFFFIELS